MELRDFRGKISVETDAVLDAHARVTGRDRSEIAREILHEWALRQIDVASLLQRRLKAEGIGVNVEGMSGSPK